MTKGTKIGIICGGILLVAVGVVMYTKLPNASITINPDGSGEAVLGNKSQTFPSGMGVMLSYHGYTLNASSTDYMLRHYSKVIESGKMTGYNGGSSNLAITYSKA